MNLVQLVFLVAVLWTVHGEARSVQDNGKATNKRHKIVRKEQVPFHVRKQYIDVYGGNSVIGNAGLGEGAEAQSYMEEAENGQPAQTDIANTLQGGGISLNSGLTQNDINGGQVDSMSSDLVGSREGTDGRQLIGNGLVQGGGGGLGVSADAGAGLGGGLSGNMNTGYAGDGYSAGGLAGSLGAGNLEGASLGANGAIDIGGDAGGASAFNDGTGASISGSDMGLGGGGSNLGGSLGGNIEGIGVGGGSVETTAGGGSLGDSGLGDSLDNSALGGSNVGDSVLGGGSFGDSGIDGSNLGAGLGETMGGVGGISDSLAGLGGNTGGSLGDGIGLDALGSRIAAGSKIQNLGAGPLGSAGGHHIGLTGMGGDNPAGLLLGMQSDHQTPMDMELSNAADENPSMMHAGLASISPGKTVTAHVSDKPTGNRPATKGPSMNAALQVQMEAQKQHQKRLQKLKVKLKKLRERLEKLQTTGDKQDKITSSEEKEIVNNEEISTLNELRMATQDAIKELHADYPRSKKKHDTAKKPKYESLGSKLKTVDFTAEETGDTLEELLKLLDPDLHDKKRGQVDGIKGHNTSRLDDEAESKLASLTKKAEEEVDKLASQNPKPKTAAPTKATENKTAKAANKTLPTSWKGVPHESNKRILKTVVLTTDRKDNTKSTKVKKTSIKFKSIGCWRDDPIRVVPSLENTSTLLRDGYRIRQDSILKCAQVAKRQGFVAFAVENGGQCFGGEQLLQRYTKYGRSRDCASDGRGGDYAMEVYKFL